MRRFFSFSGTISGSTFILRSLFTIVLSIPFIVIVFAMLGTIVFSYMDIDLASAEGMTMAESNAIGEDAGLKIAEEMMEIGPMAWFSQKISIFWIIASIISLIPVTSYSGNLILSIPAASLILILGFFFLFFSLKLMQKKDIVSAKRLMGFSIIYITFLQIIYVVDKFI